MQAQNDNNVANHAFGIEVNLVNKSQTSNKGYHKVLTPTDCGDSAYNSTSFK